LKMHMPWFCLIVMPFFVLLGYCYI